MKLKLLLRLFVSAFALVIIQPRLSIHLSEMANEDDLNNTSIKHHNQTPSIGYSHFNKISQTPLTQEEIDEYILQNPATCFAPDTDPGVMEDYYNYKYAKQNSIGEQVDGGLNKYNIATRWLSTALSGGGLVQGQKTTLTWSYVPDGTPIGNGGCGVPGESTAGSDFIAFFNGLYGPPTVPGDLTTAPWHSVFVNMFNSWSAVSGLVFVYEPNDDGATVVTGGAGVPNLRGDLRISGRPLDGTSGVLACNYFPQNGDMIIDTSDGFFGNNLGTGTINVLTHEIGHGLGIRHVCPVNQTKLMEPFVSTAFLGPQEDDILATNRMYGDPEDANDTPATSTFLGSNPNPTSYTKLQRSIDDENDFDYYAFTLAEASAVTISLTPTGTTYLDGVQFSDGSCSGGSNFNALTVADLMFDVIDTDGSTILSTANTSAAGDPEASLTNLSVAGTYYIRVRQQSPVDNVQMYNLQVDISEPCTAATTPTNLQATAITNTTADISWDAQSGVLYDLRYRQVGSGTWIDLFDLPFAGTTLNALNANTQYEVQVRAKCGTDTPSAYSASLLFTTQDITLVYCTASGDGAPDSGFFEKIDNVSFNTINNTSTSDGGYEDFTAISTTVVLGETYPITVASPDASLTTNQVIVWIDFNQDADFEDSGEQVLITPTSISPWTGNITIPATAPLGSTRMRIRLHDTDFGPNATPCGQSSYGEVEDYTLIIAPGCPTPSNFTADSVDVSSVIMSWDDEPTATDGYDFFFTTIGTIPDASTPPTLNVPAGFTSVNFVGLASNTSYDVYIRSRCGGGSTSDWSTAVSFTTLECLDTVYSGNGNTGFGDVVGNSGLTFDDDGTTITGTFTKGSGDFNNDMVIYIDSKPGGFSSTANFEDSNDADALRRAIAGYGNFSGSNRSVVNFPTGFEADYALAFNTAFGGLWELVENADFPFIDAVGNPTSATQSGFTFSFDWAEIGTVSSNNFRFVVTYLNAVDDAGVFRSDEAIGDGIPSGNPGGSDVTFTSAREYPFFYYVFDGTSWSPGNPNGVDESCRRALVQSGTANFSFPTVLGEVRVNPGAVLDIDADLTADLTFKSDGTGSGQLDNAENNTVSGTSLVELHISSNRAFRYLASPVTSTSSINTNWQEGQNNTAITLPDNTPNNINLFDGYGTHITGSSNGANGFDATITGSPSLYLWNPSNQNYDPISNTDTNTLQIGTPYTLFIRGSRAADLTTNNAAPSETILRSSGTLFTGTQNLQASLSQSANDFNLIANPYQSQVSIGDVLQNSTGIINTKAVIFDPTSGTGFGIFVTQTYDGAGNLLTNIPSGTEANSLLQPNQSFFVENSASPGTVSVTFEESYKVTNSPQTDVLNDTDYNSEFSVAIDMYETSTNDLRDGVHVRLGANYQDSTIEGEDISKPVNFLETFAIESNGNYFALDRRDVDAQNEIVNLNVSNYTATAYSFIISVENKDNNQVYLIDNYLNTEIQLSEGTFTYNFSVDPNIVESINPNRFDLKFNTSTLDVTTSAFGSGLSLYPNPTLDGQFFIKAPNLYGEVEVELVNMLGQVVQYNRIEVEDQEIMMNAGALSSGVYLVRLTKDDQTANLKLIVD